MSGRRCPSCGGLVGADAGFCGQCFAPLDGPRAGSEGTPAPAPADAAGPAPSPSAGGGGAPAQATPAGRVGFKAAERGLVWTCPVCDMENPIEAQACTSCATPFGSLLATRREAPTVPAGRATGLSLVFPGLGHWALGRVAEGLGRAFVFLWAAGMGVLVLGAGRGRSVAVFLPLTLLLFAAAIAVYALTAVDAGRLAEGRSPVVATRALTYGAFGLIMLTVLVLTLAGLGAARSA